MYASLLTKSSTINYRDKRESRFGALYSRKTFGKIKIRTVKYFQAFFISSSLL